MDLTKGLGADVVVEAAGSEESINMSTQMIKHNGKFVWYSWITQPVTLDISRWHDDGLEFINTCLVHHSWRERYVWASDALKPVIMGMVDIKPLITNEFSLACIKEAFEFVDKDNTAIKVILRP
jgi:threonine dehydrogenase-like Zn-dependent dehydrogenase